MQDYMTPTNSTLISQSAAEQFETAMRTANVVKGVLLPNAHVGPTLPKGSVVATRGKIFPAWVGYDIGCGTTAVPTTFMRSKVETYSKQIFDGIYEAVPTGGARNLTDTPWPGWQCLPKSDMLKGVFALGGLKQLGSLGHGSHFIEIGHDDTSRVWIIVHAGSRDVGQAVSAFHMARAAHGVSCRDGHFNLPALGARGKAYLKDHDFCLSFALVNRLAILRRVVTVVRQHVDGDMLGSEMINRAHNFVERRNGLWLHRTGAIAAEAKMPGLILGDMKNGTFIVRGRGAPASLFSAPCGSGRRLLQEPGLGLFRDTMGGITAKVDEATLVDSPSAHKNLFEVMDECRNLVDVVCHIKPIINVRG